LEQQEVQEMQEQQLQEQQTALQEMQDNIQYSIQHGINPMYSNSNIPNSDNMIREKDVAQKLQEDPNSTLEITPALIKSLKPKIEDY